MINKIEMFIYVFRLTQDIEYKMEEEKSIFREYFGDYPMIKVLDFLLVYRDFDYSMTEIAKKSNVGWSSFTKVWKRLLEKNIIILTRTIGNAKLFKLNTENPAVKKLIKLDWELTKFETDQLFKEKGWSEKTMKVKA